MTAASPSDRSAHAATGDAHSGRLWEIDALRGLMLVLMTLTHIPTRFSDPLGQPFGFISAAEGFVLLSGFMAGLVYTQRHLRDGAEAMRSAFFKRSLKIYVCQVALLIFLLSVVALVGVLTDQHAITNLVSFFLQKPFTAVFSGLLLMYNPPLLDILPMYIVFMLVSPLLLLFGARHGWGGILVSSGIVWLAAQFGLSQASYDSLVRLTGMPVPFHETGSFEVLAWQFLWIIGLWIGSRQAMGRPVQSAPFPRWTVRVALVIVAVNFIWRHALGQVPFPNSEVLSLAWDKWQLGPMRLLDFLALMLVVMHFAPTLSQRLPRIHALERLGQQSLPVFCAHLVLAMLVLAAFGEIDPHRSWVEDGVILAICFAVLYLVALVSAEIDRKAAEVTRRFRALRARGRSRRPLMHGLRRPRRFRKPVSPSPDETKSRAAISRSPPG